MMFTNSGLVGMSGVAYMLIFLQAVARVSGIAGARVQQYLTLYVFGAGVEWPGKSYTHHHYDVVWLLLLS